MTVLNIHETLSHTLKMPATDRVRLEVYVTTMNSVISMKNANTAPAIICSNVTTTTAASLKRKDLQLLASAMPTDINQLY